MELLPSQSLVEQFQNDVHKRFDYWRLTPTGNAQCAQIMGAHRLKAHEWRKGLTIAQLKDC